jgi:lantibiotic modifying enzyme
MAQGAMVRIPLLPVEGLTAPTFCHGLAGLLAVLLHFATDLPNDEWKGAVNEIIDRMLAHYEPDTTFGIRNQEEKLPAMDDPSLQTGAAGAALALLAASGMLEAWDAVFLLA